MPLLQPNVYYKGKRMNEARTIATLKIAKRGILYKLVRNLVQ